MPSRTFFCGRPRRGGGAARVVLYAVLLAASPLVAASAPIDADAIIRDAPQFARDHLLGWFEPCDGYEKDILAAALLDAEYRLLTPAYLRRDEATIQRREQIGAWIDALHAHYGLPGDFVYQYRTLSNARSTWLQLDGTMRVGPPSRFSENLKSPVAEIHSRFLEVGRAVVLERACGCIPDPRAPELDRVAATALLHARVESDRYGAIEVGGFILYERDEQGECRYVAPRPFGYGAWDHITLTHRGIGLIEAGYALSVDEARPCRILITNQRGESVSCAASYHVHPVERNWRFRRFSHPNWYRERFSVADLEFAYANGVPEYVITPSCTVKVYRPPPGTGTVRLLASSALQFRIERVAQLHANPECR